MVVADLTIYAVLFGVINYLIVYSKNRLAGNILFMVLGIGIWYTVASGEGWIGILFFFGGLASLIYDATKTPGR